MLFLAGFVDAIGGGGGLISLPAYLFAGLPVHQAIATNKLSSSCGTSLATLRFLKNGLINLKLALPSAAAAVLGSLLGARLSLMVSEEVMKYVLFAVLPVAAFFVLNRHLFSDREGKAEVNRRTVVVCILSALEIDTQFNVNVITGSDGVVMGAIGGHPDAADGAALTVVVAPLCRGRIPTLVEKVTTVSTPGSIVDVVVTEQGIAVNPKRRQLLQKLKEAGLPVCDIKELQERAYRIVGTPDPIRFKDKVIGLVMYRNNKLIDVIREVDDNYLYTE